MMVGLESRWMKVLVLQIVALGLLLLQPFSAPAEAQKSSCDAPGRVMNWGRGWKTVFFPVFPPRFNGDESDGARSANAWAIDPHDPKRIFVSDGTTLMRTQDGGCNWENVFQLDTGKYMLDGTPTSANFQDYNFISDLELTRDGDKLIVIAVVDRANYVATSQTFPPALDVYRSDSGGSAGTWQQVDTSLPLVGFRTKIVFSRSAPRVGYLATDDSFNANVVTRTVFRTEDAGATWEEVGEAFDYAAIQQERLNQGLWVRDPVIERHAVAVDPYDANVVWVWTRNFIRRSTDGGKTWETLRPWKERPIEGLPTNPTNQNQSWGAHFIALDPVKDSPHTAVAIARVADGTNREACSDTINYEERRTRPHPTTGESQVTYWNCLFFSRDAGANYQSITNPGRPPPDEYNAGTLHHLSFGSKSSTVIGVGDDDRILRFDPRARRWVDMSPFYAPMHLQALGYEDRQLNIVDLARDNKGLYYFVWNRSIEIYSRRI